MANWHYRVCAREKKRRVELYRRQVERHGRIVRFLRAKDERGDVRAMARRIVGVDLSAMIVEK